MIEDMNNELSLSLKEVINLFFLYWIVSFVAGIIGAFPVFIELIVKGGMLYLNPLFKNIIISIIGPIMAMVVISWYIIKTKEITASNLVGKKEFKTFNLKIYLSISLLTLGLIILNEYLVQFNIIPLDMSKPEMDIWLKLIGGVIFVPISEEIIFRGIILRGLLSKYKPYLAIAVSVLLFALIHILPWKILFIFISGSIYGMIYYKSRSLLLTIMVHSISNMISIGEQYNFINFKAEWWYSLLGIILMVIGYFLFDKFLENDSTDVCAENM